MKLLLIAFGLLFHSMLYACGGINQQVYSGKIEYALNPDNPFNCTATVTLDFDINELIQNDSIWVTWGDGNVSAVHAVSITEDTLASSDMYPTKIYTHVYSGTHIYDSLPATGYYYISFQNEYRLNGVNNIASGDGVNLPLYLMARVSIDTAPQGQYLPLIFPPLTIGFADLVLYTENGLQQATDGADNVRYAFATPLEPPVDNASSPNPVPEYQLPDQFCLANGTTNSSFTIDSMTGYILWTNPCLQGIYSFGTVLSKYRNGQLISAVMREQNIYVLASNITSGIQGVTGISGLQIYPDPARQTLSGIVTQATSSEPERLEIIAPDGRVLDGNIPVKDGRFETDISYLAAGIYFLHLQGSAGVLTEKFVKQ